MKFSVNTGDLKKGKHKEERVYILEMYIDGLEEPIYKIGKASGDSSKKRMLEIIGSYFDIFRVTPIVKIKRDRKTKDALSKEHELHIMFEQFKYTPTKKFSGSTELFKGLDLDELIKRYEEII